MWRPKSEPVQYAPVSFIQRKRNTLRGMIVLKTTCPAESWKARIFIVENGRAIYICPSIVCPVGYGVLIACIKLADKKVDNGQEIWDEHL